MPRRSLLTTVQLASLFAVPTSEEEIQRYYTLDDRDLSSNCLASGGAWHSAFPTSLRHCRPRYTQSINGFACHKLSLDICDMARLDLT